MLTAAAQRDDVVRGFDAGADEYLTKPFSPVRLLSLVEQLGGFPNQPILEDVAFCEKLVGVTAPVVLAPPVITDSRKFVKMGIWRSFVRVLLIILHVEFRLPVLPRGFFQDIR